MTEANRPSGPLNVQLHIEPATHRSAAWSELWRRIFDAIAEDFARDEAALTAAGDLPDAAQEARQ